MQGASREASRSGGEIGMNPYPCFGSKSSRGALRRDGGSNPPQTDLGRYGIAASRRSAEGGARMARGCGVDK